MNNFVIALVCTKCFKLITSEENIMSVQQLPLCLPLCYISVLCFCFTGNFSKLYCCKDCKNVITDKKFSSEQSLFCLFFRLWKFLLKYKKIPNFVAKKSHFRKYKKHFKVGFFYFSRSESYFVKHKRKSRFLKYKKVFLSRFCRKKL